LGTIVGFIGGMNRATFFSGFSGTTCCTLVGCFDEMTACASTLKSLPDAFTFDSEIVFWWIVTNPSGPGLIVYLTNRTGAVFFSSWVADDGA
jgi:hypothetical protein